MGTDPKIVFDCTLNPKKRPKGLRPFNHCAIWAELGTAQPLSFVIFYQ